MAWTTDLVLMTRVLINDMETPQRNTDTYLSQVLVTAGVLIQGDIELPYEYTFDISGPTISPDPVTSEDRIMQALLPLKAACILNQGDMAKALGRGIRVRDGDSAIDTSVSFKGYSDILKLGPCASYERLKWQIQATNAGSAGFVLSPYRAPDTYESSTISWFYDTLAITLGDRGRS